MQKIFIVLSTFMTLPYGLVAQADSLQPVTVKASKITSLDSTDRLPYSITQRRFPASTSYQQISLDEYLQNIPGLLVLNRNNYSQDLRISLRGFGARSAFGIRGIKIVVDGIPETTPDGQAQVDNLTLGIIDNINILRGPASLLYGNAAGGVIEINTLNDIDRNYAQIGATIGSYNMNKLDIQAGVKRKNLQTLIAANRTTTDGYREHSRFESTTLNLRSKLQLDDTQSLNFQLNYTDSPMALDPGGLTIEEVRADRRQARDRNVDFDGQEQVRQLKTGLSYQKNWDALSLNAYGFYTYRDFDNKLPFTNGGQVELYRNYYGHGSDLTFVAENDELRNKLQIGYSIAIQEDQRQRFDNNEGNRGDLVFDQVEKFDAYGFFAINEFQWKRWTVLGGLRYDINKLEAQDRFSPNGSNDDSRNLNSWSASAGVNYQLNNSYIYTNISTSFETPALSELSANPDGGQGFNDNLEPQRATNYELGYKKNTGRLQYNLALFYISTRDDLVPFELEEFQGRTFFRNAGSTQRLGIESSASYQISSRFTGNITYTYSDFTYDNFTIEDVSLSGKELPAIPQHMAGASLLYMRCNGFKAQLNLNYRGELFADDFNETLVDNAWISNISASYPLEFESSRLILFGGVNNLLDTDYFDNIRINAFGNRYFEPAASINVYGGVRWRL
jgi:iron complex outermembrane receptor protein